MVSIIFILMPLVSHIRLCNIKWAEKLDEVPLRKNIGSGVRQQSSQPVDKCSIGGNT
jgi:hypothetical protein